VNSSDILDVVRAALDRVPDRARVEAVQLDCVIDCPFDSSGPRVAHLGFACDAAKTDVLYAPVSIGDLLAGTLVTLCAGCASHVAGRQLSASVRPEQRRLRHLLDAASCWPAAFQEPATITARYLAWQATRTLLAADAAHADLVHDLFRAELTSRFRLLAMSTPTSVCDQNRAALEVLFAVNRTRRTTRTIRVTDPPSSLPGAFDEVSRELSEQQRVALFGADDPTLWSLDLQRDVIRFVTCVEDMLCEQAAAELPLGPDVAAAVAASFPWQPDLFEQLSCLDPSVPLADAAAAWCAVRDDAADVLAAAVTAAASDIVSQVSSPAPWVWVHVATSPPTAGIGSSQPVPPGLLSALAAFPMYWDELSVSVLLPGCVADAVIRVGGWLSRNHQGAVQAAAGRPAAATAVASVPAAAVRDAEQVADLFMTVSALVAEGAERQDAVRTVIAVRQPQRQVL
jgi:hypothetical protein